MKTMLCFVLVSLLVWSCNSNDDICVENGTPKMFIKFKDNMGLAKTLDTLYLDVEFSGNHRISITQAQANVTQILVPLRVDDSSITDFYVRTRKNGVESKIRMHYQKKLEYASPACGFRLLYQNTSSQLLQPNPVQSVEMIQNEITNENNPHLSLIF